MELGVGNVITGVVQYYDTSIRSIKLKTILFI